MKINLKITTIVLGALTALFLVIGLIMLGATKLPGTDKNGFDARINDLLKPSFIDAAKETDQDPNFKSKDGSYTSAARSMQAGAVFTVILTPIFGVATAGTALAWYKKGN